MRWRSKQQLIVYVAFIVDFCLIYWAWYTKQDISIWVALILGELTLTIPLLFKLLKADPQYDEEKLKHSETLISNVFKKHIGICDINYTEDKIIISKIEIPTGYKTEWQVESNTNMVHQSCVVWNEDNPMFKYAVQHLNHKKYRKTWEAYLNGKEYIERLINKIIEKIQQYREMVKHRIGDSGLSLIEKEYNIKEGEYDLRWINHLIYYNVLPKSNIGYATIETEIMHSSNSSYSFVFWYSLEPGCGGVEIWNLIAKGEYESLDRLKNVIEQIIRDEDIRDLILEIDSLRLALKNNYELKIFETGRREIVDQVENMKIALDGKCDRCP